jgi:putative transposase
LANHQQHPQKGFIAMKNRNKVRSHQEQSKPRGGKLFVDPSLLEKGFSIDQLIRELRLEAQALSVSAGTVLMQALIEAEVKSLVGERYSRQGEHYAWGTQKGYVVAGGQKVPILRDRVRTTQGEVELESYRRFQGDDDRTRAVFARMLASVSCRDYPKAIETMQHGYGISKSVIGREMLHATSQQVDELCHRDLSSIDLAVLVIDGIELHGSVFIAALGVDRQGVKHFLGMIEGATENADVCLALLENLKERKLVMDRPVLTVLDGSKALLSAVKRFFGRLVAIQRCQEHKIRNVKSYLPKKYHQPMERKLRAAYGMTGYDDARDALLSIVRELERMNEDAAASLREGLEETLTIHRLGLPAILRRSFASTNMLESAFSRSRHVMRNVTRWRDGRQKARWAATALLHAERSFRRIKGYRLMPMLINALDEFTKQEQQKAA